MTTDKTIKSKNQPKQTNVTWVDLSGETPVEKHFINGRWVAVSGGGSSIDISGKADKVSNATDGNFAGLDTNGNLTDSGKKASDFATTSQGVLADTAYQKPLSGIPESDLSSDVQQSLQKHFKGWYASSSALPANPVIGDYAYVKGASSTDPAAIYECTTNGTWSDSGRTADTSNVQTFASGEEVNEVHIVNDLTTGGTKDILSAEQGAILAYGDLQEIDLLATSEVQRGKSIDKTTGELKKANTYTTYLIDVSNVSHIAGKGTVYKDNIVVSFYGSLDVSKMGESWMSSYNITQPNAGTRERAFDTEIPTGCKMVAVVNTDNTAECKTLQRKNGLYQRTEGVETQITNILHDVGTLNDSVLALEKKFESKTQDSILWYEDGSSYTSQYTIGLGISDFIEVIGGTQLTIISGVRQGASQYAFACFYTEDNVSNFISSESTTPLTDVTNTVVDIPIDARYVRFTLKDKTVPAIIKLQDRIDYCVSAIGNIKGSLKAQQLPQIHNNALPIFESEQEFNILMIGSSWGVDTIAALADICNNVGLSVNTGDLYKSGGTIAQYLDDIANDGTNEFYYNHGGTNESLGNKTVLQALQYKDWDVVVMMNGVTASTTPFEGVDTDFAKLLRYLKKNCTNPRCVFAINATWTEKDEQYLQSQAYTVISALMKQSGIDLILPIGTAMMNLRNTSVNNGNDIYRDYIHLDRGVGRFTASATVFYQLVYPVFGVGLDNCSLTGTWEQGTSGTYTYPDIAISSENRATCIDCAKEAVCNQFGFVLSDE